MPVTQADRDELVRRVTRQLAGTPMPAGIVRGAVDRVLAALPDAPAPEAEGTVVVVVHRASTPDLASRWRAAQPAGVTLGELSVATEGRHTVVAARVAVTAIEAVRQAALAIGATLTTREE